MKRMKENKVEQISGLRKKIEHEIERLHDNVHIYESRWDPFNQKNVIVAVGIRRDVEAQYERYSMLYDLIVLLHDLPPTVEQESGSR